MITGSNQSSNMSQIYHQISTNFICDFTGKGNYACIEKPEEDLTGGKDVEL